MSHFRRYFEHRGGGFEYLDDVILVAATVLAGAVVIMVANVVVNRLQKSILKRRTNSEREQRTKTFLGVFRGAFVSLVVLAGVVVVLKVLHVDATPVLASAGILSVILGFGAQAVIKDILAGFFILLEDQFAVGDVVEISGVSGVVEEMTLRTTLLRDMDGAAHIIPNGGMGVVTNYTRGWSRVDLKVAVAADEDPDAVLAVLRDECLNFQRDPAVASLLDGPPEVLGVDTFDALSFTIRLLIRTKPGEQWGVRRAFRRRVLKRFDVEGIRFPATQRITYEPNGPHD